MLSTSLLRAALLLALPSRIFANVLHEQLAGVPEGWEHVATPSDSESISLEVALVQSNITEMVAALMSVSNPNSTSYGKYWTMEEVNDLVAPSTEATEATTAWLKSSGVDKIHQDGAYVTFSTTVGTANKMLNTTFAHYSKDGVTKLRTTGYSVSKDVAQHVDFIHPTTFFGKTVSAQTGTKPMPIPIAVDSSTVPANCSAGLTPDCVHQLYNVPVDYVPDKTSGAYVGFGSFLNQSARYADLFLFEKEFGIKKQNISTHIINNGLNDQNISTANDGEANLDMQNIVDLVHPLPVIEFITGGLPPFVPDESEPLPADDSNEPYLPYYKALLAMTNEELPQVISNSYGDDEQTVPLYYATHVCNLIGMMGLRGITILESSGDTGVGAYCKSNTDGKPRFNPIFPATCPYLTAVGGTQDIPQKAWVGSSGGFSDYFVQPSYQSAVVPNYINKHIKPTTVEYYTAYTNFSGRGFPDVSAMSVSPYYYGFYQGELLLNGGTSAASPTWAGIVTLLNAARLKAGLPTLGFMNPWLYGGGSAYLTDITTGHSIGCNGADTQSNGGPTDSPVIPYAQWNATKGWDPVTGFGVPDFEAMLAAVLNE